MNCTLLNGVANRWDVADTGRNNLHMLSSDMHIDTNVL